MRFKDIKKDIQNLQIIGKGWRGTVYKGKYESKVLAFKVPNKPEHLQAILKEGNILQKVNKAGIGGNLFMIGNDFIAYKFIEGKPLINVINKSNIYQLLIQLFQQARKLDELGINKDEMQRPFKNALVDIHGKVHLIDFEKAKYSKKVSNITQLLQFVLSIRNDYFTYINIEEVIKLGKEYKKNPNKENYLNIIKKIFEEKDNGYKCFGPFKSRNL